ncbi:DNA polymerase III subunit delta [Tundrisphaera sp. TA3]|uniref:DNA polymerase III subunit delta n=1 Tax=Tundrisphaera sp. TA3 TaxID=3435775 RepID=UPI003EBB5458
MHAFEFIKTAARGALKPIYALSGDDAYLRDESIKAIIRKAVDGDDMAVARFAGEQAGLAAVLDEVRTLPFLAKCRVAVVDNADPFVTAHRKELESYAEKPATSGVLILSAKTWPGSTRLAKLVDKVGASIECKTPKEAELPAWLVQHAKAHVGVRLDNDAAQLLVDLVGPEIGLLAMEVEKLAVYVGERASIGRQDVARMVGAGRVETVWRTLEEATVGHGGEALADLDRLMASGEHPVKLLAGFGYPLLKLHHAGRLRRARLDHKEACRIAEINHYGVEKARQQHAHLGPDRVERLPEMLLQADLDLKGESSLDGRIVMERLFVELARKRRD